MLINKNYSRLIFIVIIFLLSIQVNAVTQSNQKIPIYNYKIIKIYPHDKTAFTEGLQIDNGYLYESTGLNGHSQLKKIDLTSGKVLQQFNISSKYFAEGITILGNHLYQLTYQSHQGFVYDKNNFKLLKNFQYPGEGWGLTTDGKQLIMSDGTATLSFIDPANLTITRQLPITADKQPLTNINELEWIDNKIYANVWLTDFIALISPITGKVIGWINLSRLVPKNNPEAVLNGIAYNPADKTLLVTGKYWPYIYAIKIGGWISPQGVIHQ